MDTVAGLVLWGCCVHPSSGLDFREKRADFRVLESEGRATVPHVRRDAIKAILNAPLRFLVKEQSSSLISISSVLCPSDGACLVLDLLQFEKFVFTFQLGTPLIQHTVQRPQASSGEQSQFCGTESYCCWKIKTVNSITTCFHISSNK